MFITIENCFYESKINTYVYHIENGTALDNIFVTTRKTKVRFSQLYDFDKCIRGTYGKYKSLLDFPPKSPINFTTKQKDEFFQRRLKDLKKYISSLVRIPYLVKSKEFIETFKFGE